MSLRIMEGTFSCSTTTRELMRLTKMDSNSWRYGDRMSKFGALFLWWCESDWRMRTMFAGASRNYTCRAHAISFLFLLLRALAFRTFGTCVHVFFFCSAYMWTRVFFFVPCVHLVRVHVFFLFGPHVYPCFFVLCVDLARVHFFFSDHTWSRGFFSHLLKAAFEANFPGLSVGTCHWADPELKQYKAAVQVRLTKFGITIFNFLVEAKWRIGGHEEESERKVSQRVWMSKRVECSPNVTHTSMSHYVHSSVP